MGAADRALGRRRDALCGADAHARGRARGRPGVIYLDSCALVKLVAREPETPACPGTARADRHQSRRRWTRAAGDSARPAESSSLSALTSGAPIAAAAEAKDAS